MLHRRGFISAVGITTSSLLCSNVLANQVNDEGESKKTNRLTLREQESLASFDSLISSFCEEHHVPGAALSVTRDSRLMYARGFGLADRQAAQPVQPNSLFRIASLSKPITAVSVLQLLEGGKLQMEDKVHAVLGLEKPKDNRWQEVTIRQLLQHTGGWDRGASFDPMFRSVEIAAQQKTNPPAMQSDIIRFMLGHDLDFDPGSKMVYSNFGYCLLGRVIERIAKTTYADYVVTNLLKPLGIKRMRLGKTLAEERAAGEVVYYDEGDRRETAVIGKIGQQVPLPYGTWCLEAMDAHGGWLASAVDLVRFASAFDQPHRCKILKAKTIESMFARPDGAAGFDENSQPKDAFYGCGWSVRPVGDKDPDRKNTWHNGALDGTSTLLVRRHDGLNWAVLFNSRKAADGKDLSHTIDSLVHQAANEVAQWPKQDLFAEYL